MIFFNHPKLTGKRMKQGPETAASMFGLVGDISPRSPIAPIKFKF